MKYVVKLGGAGLENSTLLQGCVRAIRWLWCTAAVCS
jgi:hypothetical protein